ncbi:MAG: hypothetical protein A4E48_02310 [Methanosaeta sp. PtaU1.Bin060]|nr:MAG: hypothetical protein A4E48_02310 [Methanosaeta sp. PtaU1.Bin060]
MGEPEDLHGLARNSLREMAARELKARGPGMDGGLLFVWARRLFRGKSLEEVRKIAFEIGMLGQHGRDESEPKETHVLRALPGRAFSALKLLCIMYYGFKFKQFEPGMDIGVDPLRRGGGWRRG